MISYKEAKEIVIKAGQARACKSEQVSTHQAVGRVCAAPLQAPLDIQPFDNSAMDGFAVRLEDLANAAENTPISLMRSGMIAAGDGMPEETLQTGQCIEIMTGAPTPPGADAVVPVELVRVQGDNILFHGQPEKGANIRTAGQDFKKGMDVLTTGDMIHPHHIMPLATLGIAQVQVFQKPKVAYLVTGLELVDDLAQPLQPGQIYNSNGPLLTHALKTFGVEALSYGTIADDPEAFEQKLSSIIESAADIAISTGAVSAGKFDFVREGLEKAGAEILFHKVKIKPGKPNLVARLPNGTLYFGLPGNPVATAVGLRFFVHPCLQAMLHMGGEKPVYATATTPFKKRAGLKMFLKAQAKSQGDGRLTVNILDGQASFMVHPFLNMNCWAVTPEDMAEIKVGDIIALYPIDPHSGLL